MEASRYTRFRFGTAAVVVSLLTFASSLDEPATVRSSSLLVAAALISMVAWARRTIRTVEELEVVAGYGAGESALAFYLDLHRGGP